MICGQFHVRIVAAELDEVGASVREIPEKYHQKMRTVMPVAECDIIVTNSGLRNG